MKGQFILMFTIRSRHHTLLKIEDCDDILKWNFHLDNILTFQNQLKEMYMVSESFISNSLYLDIIENSFDKNTVLKINIQIFALLFSIKEWKISSVSRIKIYL